MGLFIKFHVIIKGPKQLFKEILINQKRKWERITFVSAKPTLILKLQFENFISLKNEPESIH